MPYSTPGVYIDQRDSLPIPLAEVSTTIPAFIGVTQKRPQAADDPNLVPIKVSSLSSYQCLFGTGPNEPLTVARTYHQQHPASVELNIQDKKLKQIMYYNIQMFFNNGGGDCYIVSLGDGDGANTTINEYIKGIRSLEQKTEITLIVLTDASYYLGDDDDIEGVYAAALEQCRSMHNRFVIFDAKDKNEFRNQVGSDNLEYGAAYSPFLYTTLNYIYDNQTVTVHDVSGTFAGEQFRVTYVGEIPVAYFAVKKDSTLSDNDIQFSCLENSLTVLFNNNTSNPVTVDSVLTAWNQWPQKNSFALAAQPEQGENEVVPQPRVELTTYSYFSKQENSLFFSYRGHALDRPTVVMKKVNELDHPMVEIVNDQLLIQYQAGDTCSELVNYFNNLRVNNSAYIDGFSIALAGDAEGNDPISMGEANGESLFLDENGDPIKLQPSDFLADNVSGLQIGYVGQEGAVVSTVESTDEESIVFEVEGRTLTITASVDTPLTEIVSQWSDYPAKGAFTITPFKDPKATFTELTDQHLYPIINSIQLSQLSTVDTFLYNQVKDAVNAATINHFPPSGAMAGIYNTIDQQSGVWTAPANISINSVMGPSRIITVAQQVGYNEDPATGKSINVIRPFPGKGTLVWGARTLDGNSHNWRYISVRRLVSFIESHIRKGLQNYVFEPNTEITWLQVRALIEPFLENLWNAGALAGAKMEDAFFVNIGLGTTMTPQDILEGRMIISTGLAAVRPAEFILLEVTQVQQK